MEAIRVKYEYGYGPGDRYVYVLEITPKVANHGYPYLELFTTDGETLNATGMRLSEDGTLHAWYPENF